MRGGGSSSLFKESLTKCQKMKLDWSKREIKGVISNVTYFLLLPNHSNNFNLQVLSIISFPEKIIDLINAMHGAASTGAQPQRQQKWFGLMWIQSQSRSKAFLFLLFCFSISISSCFGRTSLASPEAGKSLYNLIHFTKTSVMYLHTVSCMYCLTLRK